MNKERRKEIAGIREDAELLKDRVEEVRGHESEYYDNMPESIQSGEKGDAALTAVDQLEMGADYLEEVMNFMDAAAE